MNHRHPHQNYTSGRQGYVSCYPPYSAHLHYHWWPLIQHTRLTSLAALSHVNTCLVPGHRRLALDY
ncbi:hypothetical protein Hamer_G004386 [Homarus americanus]|uniref:Uncharacterized protein n=1 Tax=Homarus americanus TaxID=6706 RepID=A0A8J5JS72_HOMAM|nr:hypothetical protein Hamer_G004386 [Homarus americanus]